ncbi:MAG: carboxylating nicotinate-nucleotide diphosphorylase, partial [Gammaproteobacteria bacterium]|nr:carboxylating nicotinate-nucleotide diphosphorylase [Gammaproteobacteria bacterium]
MMNKIIVEQVTASLLEDIGEGDITAALLPANSTATATVITRQDMLVCGLSWFDEVYRQLDKNIKIKHFVQEGDWVKANTRLIELSGLTRSLLTGERSALNWLQTLSATATVTRQYLSTLENTKTKLLDTRKTLPGFRYAQKYAVKVAGGHNHRMGLFDAYLIKENHIVACGSIAAAIERAVELNPDKLVEIEVENLAEF